MIKTLQRILLVTILCLTFAMVAAAQESVIQTVTAYRTEQAPNLDGVLDDDVWLEASKAGSKIVVDLAYTSDYILTYPKVGYVAYDDTAIYVGVAMTADPYLISTSATGTWGVFSNDSVEVFVQPKGVGPFYKAAIDAAGAFSTGGGAPWPLAESDFAYTIEEYGWFLEVKVLWDKIGATPAPGDVWRFNLCVNQVGLGITSATWNHIVTGGFNNNEYFGKIVFGE